MTEAAFFDLDRTLISGSSGFYWARAAAGAGLVSRRDLAGDIGRNAMFKLRGSTDKATDKVKGRVAAILEGRRPVEFSRLGPQVLAGVLPRLYPQMLEIAWGHQDAGRRVYIATAASQETGEMVAHVLGFDGAVGTRFEVDDDGVYTGRLAGPFAYRDGKAQLVRELAAQEGIDLDACFAYSDSESDLPFLEAVGHPVVVNPDPELARVAREREWDVLRFERLGARLKMLGGLSVASVAGATVLARRRPAPRARPAIPRRR